MDEYTMNDLTEFLRQQTLDAYLSSVSLTQLNGYNRGTILKMVNPKNAGTQRASAIHSFQGN